MTFVLLIWFFFFSLPTYGGDFNVEGLDGCWVEFAEAHRFVFWVQTVGNSALKAKL